MKPKKSGVKPAPMSTTTTVAKSIPLIIGTNKEIHQITSHQSALDLLSKRLIEKNRIENMFELGSVSRGSPWYIQMGFGTDAMVFYTTDGTSWLESTLAKWTENDLKAFQNKFVVAKPTHRMTVPFGKPKTKDTKKNNNEMLLACNVSDRIQEIFRNQFGVEFWNPEEAVLSKDMLVKTGMLDYKISNLLPETKRKLEKYYGCHFRELS